MPHRSRKEALTYRRYVRTVTSCEFCKYTPESTVVVGQTNYFYVVKNIFPYSFWDDFRVLDHLMIVPKQHVDSLHRLPTAAAADFVEIIWKYEKEGYNFYGRPADSRQKSVAHQHTHLIKSDTTARPGLVVFAQIPYLRWLA